MTTRPRKLFRTIWATTIVVVVLFASLMTMFMVININGAVLGVGVVIVETYGKRIQHPDGGIISEILVDDGVEVKEADVLIRLDDTVVRTDLGVVKKSIDKFRGKKARLEAERDRLDEIDFPQDLLDRRDQADVAQLLRVEMQYFKFRRSNLQAKTDQLRERIRQWKEEISGYEAQRKSKIEQMGLTVLELDGVKSLVKLGDAALTRQLALDKARADLDGQVGQLIAQIAQSRGKIAETELSIVETNETFFSSAVSDLRDVDAQLNELEERRTAADDKLKRIEVRSPRNGIVHDLSVHTIGGVVKAGEILMTIIPKEDRVVIEAKVSIDDIDQVEIGQAAFLRFTSVNRKTTPELQGAVNRVGADSLEDPVTKAHYYPVRVTFSDEEFQELYDIKARPGMAAEVHIKTTERSVMSYLIKPVTDQAARAFRED